MIIHRRRGWEIPEREATPEAVVLGRRALLGAGAGLGAMIAGPASAQWNIFGRRPNMPDLAARKPLPAPMNAAYEPGRALTPELEATTYNNYYEFGESKSIYDAAKGFSVEPWTIEIAGQVAKPRKIGFEDLLKQVTLQERVTRHRCVERWAMTVPWVGFPLADLVKLAEPTSKAKYLIFTSAADKKTMPGLNRSYYPWPYVEGVTMQEAANDLSFISVGMYGKVLPTQNGAPLRLTLPWKYGFKHAKAIVKIEFSEKRPVSFWEALNGDEYGFWANINPAVAHPRWSQSTETLLGTDETVPTKIWNGYGEFVAGMYADKKNERLFA